MPFDIERITRELDEAPLAQPLPWDLAVAIVCDQLRHAGRPPIPVEEFDQWRADGGEAREAILGSLGHFLQVPSMDEETVSAWANEGRHRNPIAVMERFLKSVAPLTPELLRTNAFRREELVRKWITQLGGGVEGETKTQQRSRNEQLDYRKAMKEFQKAERARKKEAARRKKLLEEARKRREEEARAWRE